MARIRTIKPEFWTSEQIMELSPMARLLFIGMWNFCDDRGIHPVAYKTLKAEVFPADDVTSAQVEQWVGELIQQGLLVTFPDHEGRQWWSVTGWHHQLINRPSKTRYPEPPREAPLPSAAGHDSDESLNDSTGKIPENGHAHGVLTEDSLSIHGVLTEDSLSIHGVLTEDSLTEGKGREGKGKEGKKKTPKPPLAQPAAVPTVENLDSTAWERWAAYRSEIRKAIKPVSMPAAQRQLAGFGADQAAVVEQSIANGWQGLFPLKHMVVKPSQAPTEKTCHCGAQGVVMRGGKWFCSEHEPKVVSIQPAKETRHVAAG